MTRQVCRKVAFTGWSCAKVHCGSSPEHRFTGRGGGVAGFCCGGVGVGKELTECTTKGPMGDRTVSPGWIGKKFDGIGWKIYKDT